MFMKKKGKLNKTLLRVIKDEFESMNSDIPCDFDHYFTKSNPQNMVKINLKH